MTLRDTAIIELIALFKKTLIRGYIFYSARKDGIDYMPLSAEENDNWDDYINDLLRNASIIELELGNDNPEIDAWYKTAKEGKVVEKITYIRKRPTFHIKVKRLIREHMRS